MSQLYFSLNKNIQNIDLKKNEKKELIDMLPSLDLQTKEAFFLLIYEHMIETKKDEEQIEKDYKLPYEGIGENNSVTFNLSKFPIELRRILYKFIKIVQKNESN